MEGYRGATSDRDQEQELRCEGTLTECSAVQTSTVTDVSAAVFKHSIGTRIARTNSDGQTSYVHKLVGSVVVSGDLLIDTAQGVVRVPEGSFNFKIKGVLEQLPALAGPLPPACEHLVLPGTVLYDEKFLSLGDVVELTATVRPSREPNVRYEVVPDRDAILIDRTLESMGIDVDGLQSGFGRILAVGLGLFILLIVAVVGYVTFYLN